MAATAILGKTCSGKTTIVDKLVSSHGYKKIITYTSRPMRNKEVDGKDYHFISEIEFREKIHDGFFAEWKSYNTEFGKWFYGVAKEDLENTDEKSLLIITPDGYSDIKNAGIYLKTIYIYANNQTIRERLKKRGDNKEEADRRIYADNIDFKGFENEADIIVYNNNNRKINDVVNKILRYLGE